jgi:alanyl-tRNA synthetase
MITNRLYYTDSYLRNFEAPVIAQREWAGRTAVALEHSAFYPEGGGQPADQGLLQVGDTSYQVIDVQVEDEVVWHVCSGAGPAVGSRVRGSLDWARRFDHMQQHCGQHILTAAFVASCTAQTIAFHLSANSVTIDLASDGLNAEQVAQAEMLANELVWQDLPVVARFVSNEELAQIRLRKAASVSQNVRVVSIGDVDHSACGGTHPRSSGSVGAIVVRSWSRQKGGVRVDFACGGRALHEYRRVRGVATRAASGLSVGIDELEAAVERLRSSGEQMRKELAEANQALVAQAAQRLYTEGEICSTARIICSVEEGGIERLRSLAQQIGALPGGVAILGATGERAQIVVACHAASGRDARAILQAGLPLVSGKGGGTQQLAQGGGPAAAGLAAALAAMCAKAREQ